MWKNIRKKRRGKNSIITTLGNSFWQLLQKLMLRVQKLTFLSSDFFAESQNWHTMNTWRDFWGCSKKLARSNNCISSESYMQLANHHLSNFAKNDATATKTNFFEFWFFCWIKNLSYFYHLKGFEVIPKDEFVVTFWKSLSFLFLP